MQAYQVQPEGFGFTAALPLTNKFFWSRLSASRFCETQLSDHIRLSMQKQEESAGFHGGFYNTLRKFNALENIRQFNRDTTIKALPELACQVIELEPDLRAILPSKSHPFHHESRARLNDLVWLCIRIRKQYKKV